MFQYLRSLTPAQWFGVIIAILAVTAGATSQLSDLFGPQVAKTVVTAANFLMTIMSAILVPMTGQSAQISAVNAMPGVSKIVVNAQANPTLAISAVDPSTKVEPSPEAAAAVQATAEANK